MKVCLLYGRKDMEKNFLFFFIFTAVIVCFKRKVKSTYISAFQNWKQSRNIFATMIYECKWIKPFWGSYMYLYRTVYFRFWKKVLGYVTPWNYSFGVRYMYIQQILFNLFISFPSPKFFLCTEIYIKVLSS